MFFSSCYTILAVNNSDTDQPVTDLQLCCSHRIYVFRDIFQGSHIWSKLRPVDQLRQLLIECQGSDTEEIKAYFSRLHKVPVTVPFCTVNHSCTLTHISLVSFLWDRGKQCRPDQTPQNAASDQGLYCLLTEYAMNF